jgi:hypothetical protein
MKANKFLLQDKLTTIKYNEFINIIKIDNHLYQNYTIDNINKYIETVKVHSIFKKKGKHKILRITLVINNTIKHIFIDFTGINYTQYENHYSEYYNIQKYYENTVKLNISNNSFKLQEHVFTTYYVSEYIKGSKGKKQLSPYKTIINNNCNLSNLLEVIDKYYNHNDTYQSVKKIYKYHDINKVRICKILFGKKNTYFKILSNDLINNICKYI